MDAPVYYRSQCLYKYKEAKEPEAIRNKNTANHLQMECDPSKREKRIVVCSWYNENNSRFLSHLIYCHNAETSFANGVSCTIRHVPSTATTNICSSKNHHDILDFTNAMRWGLDIDHHKGCKFWWAKHLW